MVNQIAIIIPTYNEEKNIERLIKKIRYHISNVLIVVVDDSNNDKILNIVKKKKLNIIYFNRGKKLGRGSAVIFGLKKILNKKKIKAFIEMDADFSHDPVELKRNIKYFFEGSLDLLIGSRYLKESKIINWSLSRRIFSYLANFSARNLLQIPIQDFTNGYRIYSRRSVKRIVKNCGKIGDGFIILSEILVELYLNNYKIDEIHSKFVNRTRGESSVNFKLILEAFFGLVKIYFKKRKLKNLAYR
jgi:dolichol-phosphate mannosyltransferase|tara:strand:+ start:797 stop:1531 length:735 start_codon:yes stop_codon:yes gene_type:complete